MYRTILTLVLSLIAVVRPAAGAERVLNLDLEATDVTFTLGSTLHTVEGVLFLSEGNIVFDDQGGEASGSVVFDATLTDTGNEKRDKKMHKKVLVSEKFPKITFSPEAVQGALAESGTSDLKLLGSIDIIGTVHPVALDARVERDGDTISATAEVIIPYVAWGLEDPSVFILRADKEVKLSFEIHGILAQ